MLRIMSGSYSNPAKAKILVSVCLLVFYQYRNDNCYWSWKWAYFFLHFQKYDAQSPGRTDCHGEDASLLRYRGNARASPLYVAGCEADSGRPWPRDPSHIWLHPDHLQDARHPSIREPRLQEPQHRYSVTLTISSRVLICWTIKQVKRKKPAVRLLVHSIGLILELFFYQAMSIFCLHWAQRNKGKNRITHHKGGRCKFEKIS